MGQQASLTKLKEQIEAAKRSLSEMPSTPSANDTADGAMANDVISDPNATVKPKFANTQLIDKLKIPDTIVVDLTTTMAVEVPKVAEINNSDAAFNKLETNDHYSRDKNSIFEGFHFFHRKKKMENILGADLKNPPILENVTIAHGTRADCLFNDFDRRLKAIESGVAQNCLHTDELLKITAQLVFSKGYASKPKSMRRLVRRYVFWLVIGCLALGWFALTPLGHIGFNYLFTLK